MADYGRALNRPFEDLGKLAIGAVLTVIPLANILAIGYNVKIAEATLKGSYKMPPWEDWGELFIKGLLVVVAGIIYLIPALVLGAIALGSVFAGILGGGLMLLLLDPGLLVGAILGAGAFFLLALLLGIFAAYLMPAATISYAKSGKFGAFFGFREIFAKAFRGGYFVAWLASGLIGLVLVMMLSLVPVIGTAIGAFVGGVVGYTVMTEACMEK